MEKEMIRNQSTDVVNDLKKERLFLDVLCREYTSVFCMDFDKNTLEILKLDPSANAYDLFGNESRKKLDYISVIKDYDEVYVADECKEEFLKVMNPDYLRKKNHEDRSFYISVQKQAKQSATMQF